MTQPLTATANGYQQRPATAHNARTIGANLGYVRPENGRSVVADGHDPEYTRNAPDRLNDQRSGPGRQEAQIRKIGSAISGAVSAGSLPALGAHPGQAK